MKRISLSILSLIWLVISVDAAPPLSDQASISLLTCVSGTELYSAFGHSAIRVRDPLNQLDRVYNYGTFDFETPGFYLKFARGQLNYYLNAYDFSLFVREYQYYKRSFSEQVLNLTSEQTQDIYDFLEFNHLPENRFYQYDFFFDNCATRIRDVFFESLEGSVQLLEKDEPGEKTFRNLLDEYLGEKPWADFGIDLALGSVIDQPATLWDQTFLPDYLAEVLSKAEIRTADGMVPLIKTERSLYETESPITPASWWMYPIFPFSLLALVIGFFTWKNWQSRPDRYTGDGILFTIAGIAGIILLLLWVATDHDATNNNWNLLWLNPLHIIPGIMLLLNRQSGWLRHYMVGTAAVDILILLGWMIIPQQFHLAFIPLILIVLIRSIVLFMKLRPQ